MSQLGCRIETLNIGLHSACEGGGGQGVGGDTPTASAESPLGLFVVTRTQLAPVASVCVSIGAWCSAWCSPDYCVVWTLGADYSIYTISTHTRYIHNIYTTLDFCT